MLIISQTVVIEKLPDSLSADPRNDDLFLGFVRGRMANYEKKARILKAKSISLFQSSWRAVVKFLKQQVTAVNFQVNMSEQKIDEALNKLDLLIGSVDLRWKPVSSNGIGLVDRLVGLPVASRFFYRQVKPVEKSVKFFFLATKKHLSTNRNMHIYMTINKTFYKKTVL